MNFDIKGTIEELVGKFKADPRLLKDFESDPIRTIEDLVGIDLPKDKLLPLVEGIRSSLGGRSDLGSLLGGVKKLF